MKTIRPFFGFDLGPGGNANGLGSYMQECKRLGAPLMIMGHDAFPLEAQQVAQAQPQVGHRVIFRRSVTHQGSTPPSGDPNVPQYHLPAQEAAQRHLAWHVAHMPPEMDPATTYLGIINECDQERAAWLFDFSYYADVEAEALGVKLAHLGWATGTPRIPAWDTPEATRFLDRLQDQKGRALLMLHDYSLTVNDIWAQVPYLVGRISLINPILDRDLDVVISEFGWTYNDVAGPWGIAQQHLHEAMIFYAGIPQVNGCMIWYLGPGYNGIADKLQPYIQPITQWTTGSTYTRPDDPIPPPSGEWQRIWAESVALQKKEGIRVLPSAATFVALVNDTLPGGHRIVVHNEFYTARAAGGQWAVLAGEIVGEEIKDPHRAIYAWHPEEGVVKWAPGTTQPPPGPGPGPGPWLPARVGLHASADPGAFYGAAAEYAEFKALVPEVVKVLDAHSPQAIGRLADDMASIGAQPTWIVRIFQSWGERDITPKQFVAWTIDNAARSLAVLRGRGIPSKDVWVEVHNEPNLAPEGWGFSWDNGTQFAGWLLEVLRLYKQQLPQPRYMFPGLSPGGAVPDIRYDATRFLNEAAAGVAACEGLGAHAYWISDQDRGAAAGWVAYHSRFQKPVWVTEASYKGTALNAADMAAQYHSFTLEAKAAEGVTFFVASASDPGFHPECWIVNGKSKGIAAAMARLSGVGLASG